MIEAAMPILIGLPLATMLWKILQQKDIIKTLTEDNETLATIILKWIEKDITTPPQDQP